jgi:dihydrofolate reductase
MKAIIAVNNLGFIGLGDGLPWPKCLEDFKHFKQKNPKSNTIGWL